MSTYRELSYSILDTIKQTFDDASVTIPQILFWIRMISNKIRSQTIESKKETNQYLQYFPNVKIYTDAESNRKYSVLPETILDIDKDGGIDTITWAKKFFEACNEPLCNHFSRTSPAKVSVLCSNYFRRPSKKNVKFFRSRVIHDGEYVSAIIYLGLECIDILNVDMYLHVATEASLTCDLDEEIGISPKNEIIVYYEVLNLARFGFLIPEERKNDGADNTFALTGKDHLPIPVSDNIMRNGQESTE